MQSNQPYDAAHGEGTPRTRIILVTGLSGAGKSSALKAMEDLGYDAIDNLPLSLLPQLLEPQEGILHAAQKALAVGVDSRTRAFNADSFAQRVDELRRRGGLDVKLLFFDCSDEILRRRFTETRRPHPLASGEGVMEGVATERRMMETLRKRADYVFDTSDYTGHDLRRLLSGHFAQGEPQRMMVSVTSFSFRQGVPREADILFDVRFLANPYYVESMRAKTGRDADVAAFIAKDPTFAPFFESMHALVISTLPHYQREGKAYLTLAFGCTGGRHRSVYVAERMADVLQKAGFQVNLRHRDAESP